MSLVNQQPRTFRNIGTGGLGNLLSSIRFGYAIFGIAIYQGAFTQTLRELRGDDRLIAGQTEIAATIAQAIIMLGLGPALWPYRRRLKALLGDLIPYCIIIGLCGISALWSAYPFPTVRRTITLSVCLLFGLWCHLSFGLSHALRLVARTTVVLGILSIVVFVAVPTVGHEVALGYESAMRGVFSQKNTLGAAMLLPVTCYLYEIYTTPTSKYKSWVSIIFLMGCGVLAHSATSLLVSLFVIGLAIMVYIHSRQRTFIILMFTSLAICFALGLATLVDADVVFGLIGRDPNFTGRMPLWILSLKAASVRPLLGYGYSGFWTEDSMITQYIWAMINWKAPSAHNGYLDIVLQIGIVGLVVYMYMWVQIIVRAWRAKSDPTFPEAFWILLFMITNILLNTDEGPLPYPDQFTLLMPGVIISLALWTRRQQTNGKTRSLVSRKSPLLPGQAGRLQSARPR